MYNWSILQAIASCHFPGQATDSDVDNRHFIVSAHMSPGKSAHVP